MKTHVQKEIEKLKQKCDDALHQLIYTTDHPCRGQVYTFEKGNKTYVKWQICVNGKRKQRSFKLDALEILTTGIEAQKTFTKRLETYFTACDSYMNALALAHTHDVTCETKKNNMA